MASGSIQRQNKPPCGEVAASGGLTLKPSTAKEPSQAARGEGDLGAVLAIARLYAHWNRCITPDSRPRTSSQIVQEQLQTMNKLIENGILHPA